MEHLQTHPSFLTMKKKINVLFSESTNTHHWEIYKLPLSFSGNY